MSHDDDGTATAAAARPREHPWIMASWKGGSVECELPASGSIVAGRGAECDLVIPHRSVSRRHVRVHAGPPLTLEDLGSVNGTFLGDRRLAPGAPMRIRSGESLRAGDVILIVHRPAAPAVSLPEELEELVDPASRRVAAMLEELARGEMPVLLLGETGAGKTTAAERIHRLSHRSGALVRTSCVALAQSDGERELAGAGGVPGVLERAHGGTLLLESIDDLPGALQARILRAIEAREVVRLDATSPREVNARIVTTGSVELAERVRTGALRRDLYYRLGAASVTLLPLRARPLDILPLARHFLARAIAVHGLGPVALRPDAEQRLVRHDWPGNLRELRNVVETSVFLARDGFLDASTVGGVLGTNAPPVIRRPAARALAGQMADVERARITEALETCAGNQTRAAEMLGISRRTLVARLTEYGLPRPLKGR